MGTANYSATATALIERLMSRGFKPLGKGSTRASFVRKNLIIKIPKSISYFGENFTEGHISKRSKKCIFTWKEDGTRRTIKIAKTRLFMIDGIPVIVMEKVIPVTRDETSHIHFKRPDWLSDMLDTGDGYQVGRDRFGELKAFDFGHMHSRCKINKKIDLAISAFGEEGYGIDYKFWQSLKIDDSYGTNKDDFVRSKMHLLKFS